MIKKSLILFALMAGSLTGISGNGANKIASVDANQTVATAKRALSYARATITGRLQIVDDYGVTHPLAGVKVEVAFKTTSSLLDGILPDTTYTNSNGMYTLHVDFAALIGSNSSAILTYLQNNNALAVKVYPNGEAINVVDANRVQYVYESDAFRINSTASAVVDHTFTTEDTLGKAFSVSQAAINASKFAKYLNYGENIQTCTIMYPTADGAYYSGNYIHLPGTTHSTSTLNVRPNSHQDFDCIGHEYGHHVQRVFNITHNPGGTHYSTHNAEDDFHDQKNSSGTNMYTEMQARRRGLDLAYAEGWATAYSLLAQKHFESEISSWRYTCDSSYTAYNGVNVNYGTYEVRKGEGAEESVTGFIWNIFDDEANSVDPWDTVSMPDDMLLIVSHDAYTFDEFYTNYMDGEPDEHVVGKIAELLKISPTNITAGTLYTNVAPTFTWDVGGGSKYYSNNEFYFYMESGFEFYYDSVSVAGTASKASINIPADVWSRMLASNDDEIMVYVSGSCDRNSIRTGGYTTSYYYFDKPTISKEAPANVVMTPGDWGFAQKYDGAVLTTSFTRNDVHFTTERLRTGTIEKNQVVLSAKKKGAGRAYFEIVSDYGWDYVNYDISLWSASEGITAKNSSIIVEVLGADGEWNHDADLWTDATLPTNRNNMLSMRTFDTGSIYGIRFTVTGPASGSSNAGRVAIRNMTFGNY